MVRVVEVGEIISRVVPRIRYSLCR